METRLEYLFGSGNTLNTLKIQKYWNKIIQKISISILKYTLNIASTLHSRVENDIFFKFVSAFKLVHFSDLLRFKYAYFCL